jgi:hypothetical protein
MEGEKRAAESQRWKEMTEFDEAPQSQPYLETLSQTTEQTMSLIRARSVKHSVARNFPMLVRRAKPVWSRGGRSLTKKE